MAEQSAADVARGVEQVTDEVLQFLASCDDQQWAATVPGEEWPVGVVLHHIAEGFGLGQSWVLALSRGQAITMTGEDIDETNAAHAAACTADKDETAADLRRASAELVATLQSLDDGAWASTAPFGPAGGREVAVADMAAICIGHARGHLESARAALS